MAKGTSKKVLTDADVKKKAVRLVISHLKKKVVECNINPGHFDEWIEEMDILLEKSEFVLAEYLDKRREFNDIVERVSEQEARYKLRDSWYSLGKALEKKVMKYG